MASIFSYDPDPPRVASPWLTPTDTPKTSTPQPPSPDRPASTGRLADYGVTRLEAEPQEGPTEYKLHLLLRPRRNYSSFSTGKVVSGSQQHRQQVATQPSLRENSSILAPSNQSRQNRLEQLTTQLLWRLQQSSPYHASSTSDLVLPKLPEASETLEAPKRPGKLLAGLEESRGALYEIGVSDDGTLVGLTKDEMDESLNNLRSMAASLGCNVEVVRMVVVGDCEWQEAPRNSVGMFSGKRFSNAIESHETLKRQEQLWVAEALVIPDLSSRYSSKPSDSKFPVQQVKSPQCQMETCAGDQTVGIRPEQLRVTLTGPTTSGKSSLLGTLSTATLDNGRGKSRLSLLKHRHEIASGVTSSVAQELLGYKGSDIINYASGNVTSWTDIHASAEYGRLVFVSDSAGHPKFRRTIVRGLVGWAPHWTVLCIAADEGENTTKGAGGTSTAQDILGTAGIGIDLAKAHLDLCLKLHQGLVVVVTKLDLASKNSLRQTLSKVLSAIKATGRTPSIIPPDSAKIISNFDLVTISQKDEDEVRKVVGAMNANGSLTDIVPIIMTSAAKGTGVRALHALLSSLPIPPTPTAYDLTGPALNPEQPQALFHVEDVFDIPASYEPLASSQIVPSDSGVVIAGYLRFGKLSVGDCVVIGPFPTPCDFNEFPTKSTQKASPHSFGIQSSHPPVPEATQTASRKMSLSVIKDEWYSARIMSLRNLRLPVHTLEAGQVGTIGVRFGIELSNDLLEKTHLATPRIRKGMVVAIPGMHMLDTGHTLQAASGFTASFADSDINSVSPGSLVVTYVASIRASARVLKLFPHADTERGEPEFIEEEDVFGLTTILENAENQDSLIFGSDGITHVTFELTSSREWIELGSQVLVMPGGGHGLYYGSERGEKGIAGLEGFVGKVVEIVD